jgi:hypothetical protein
MDDDPWIQSSQYFAVGRLRSAQHHYSRIQLSPSASIVLQSALKIDATAIQIAEVIRSSECCPASSVYTAEIVAGEAHACALRCDRTSLSTSAFASECALSASYNATLAALHGGYNSKALVYVDRGMEELARSALAFLERERDEPSNRPLKRLRGVGAGIEMHVDLDSSSRDTWDRARNACEALCLRCPAFSDTAEIRALRRWADAAGSMAELAAATYVLCGKRVLALEAVHLSESAWSLYVALHVQGRAGDCPSQIRTVNAEVQTEDDFNDADSSSAEYDGTDQALNLKGRGASESVINIEQRSSSPPRARARCIAAISCSVDRDYDNALSLVRDDALGALHDSNALIGNTFFALSDVGSETKLEVLYWPNVYVAATVLLLRGERADLVTAIALLEICAGAGYRVADAIALVARIEIDTDAVQRWQHVFTMDCARPGGLWTAAKVFASLGREEARASLLECLSAMLSGSSNEIEERKMEPKLGVVDLSPAHLANGKGVLPLDLVRLERARAMSASGRWKESLMIYKSVLASVSGSGYGLQSSGHHVELFGLLRDYAWTLARAKMLDCAVETSERAILAATSGLERCAVYLAEADAMLNGEKVDSALQAARTSFHEAELNLVADGAVDNMTLQFLRGTCYNNMGVLETCKQDLYQACTSFEAAQIAFGKCAESHSEQRNARLAAIARRFQAATLFNRVLVLFQRKAYHQGVGLWLEHAGPHVSDWASDELSMAALQNLRQKVSELEISQSPEASEGGHVLGGFEEKQSVVLSLVCATQAGQHAVHAAARGLLRDLTRPAELAAGVGIEQG